MKAFGKFLIVAGIGTALAALLPYRVTKNEETGERKFKALTWDLDLSTDEDGVVAEIHIPPRRPEDEFAFDDEDYEFDAEDDVEFAENVATEADDLKFGEENE